jgi:SAM-dependent methyltransferase
LTTRSVADWWTKAFRRAYLDVYAHRDDASAEREAKFVASLLGVAPAARLLDAGCGAGRHARAFAALGADVFAIDYSEELLAEARRRGGARCVRADFRRLPFRDGSFAHVVSLFTSFGYFDDEGDRAHLAEVRRVLRPGGTFVLDFLSAPRVAATLVASSERKVGDRIVRERRCITDGRVEKDVEVLAADGKRVDRWKESVRLYGREEMTAMLVAAGLRAVSVHGDLAGGVWSDDADRLVLAGVAQ